VKLPGDIDWGMAWAVWRRNATHYKHTWLLNIFPNFFEPLLYLVGMGIGLGHYVQMGGDRSYVEIIAPGLLAASAMNGATFETTYNIFVKMNFAGVYDAYLCTPAQLQDVAFGELMWAVTRALLYGVGFLAVLAGLTLAGWQVITSWWACALPLAIVLIGALFGLIGEAFTAKAKVIDLYGYYYTLWLTPLFLFSGIFFPPGDRVPYGDAIAWCTPLYHGVRLSRGLCHGEVDAAMWISVAWMLVACALLQLYVPRAMRARVIH